MTQLWVPTTTSAVYFYAVRNILREDGWFCTQKIAKDIMVVIQSYYCHQCHCHSMSTEVDSKVDKDGS